MSKKPLLNTKASLNAISMKTNIRSMLRRNLTFMLSIGDRLPGPSEREELKRDSENMARNFAFTLGILLSYMSDEEICDYLDGWKHIITDGPRELIEFK